MRSEETKVTGPLLTKADVTAHHKCLVISNTFVLFFKHRSPVASQNQVSAKFSPQPLEGTLEGNSSTSCAEIDGAKENKVCTAGRHDGVKDEERQEDGL